MAEFDVDALRAMLSSYDEQQKSTDTTEPEATVEQPTQEETVAAPAPEQPAPVEQTEATPEPEVTVAGQVEKDANAFAQMRTQNKMMSDMLAKIAKANGIQYNNQDELMAKLNDDSVTKLAAAQGVPKELLLRMEGLERDAAAYRAQQNQSRLVGQMQNIMQKYGASAEELQSFAATLDKERVDVNTVDVEREYFFRNQDAIMQKRINAAVEAALRGDAEASAHASTPAAPGATSGSNTGTKVNTVADLRSFLASASKQ